MKGQFIGDYIMNHGRVILFILIIGFIVLQLNIPTENKTTDFRLYLNNFHIPANETQKFSLTIGNPNPTYIRIYNISFTSDNDTRVFSFSPPSLINAGERRFFGETFDPAIVTGMLGDEYSLNVTIGYQSELGIYRDDKGRIEGQLGVIQTNINDNYPF